MTAALVKKDLLKEADDLRRLLEELSRRAATDLEAMVDRLLANGASVSEVRDVVTAIFPDVAKRYAGAAATATADWYDDLGPDGPSSPAPDPDRFMPSMPDIEEILPEARLLGTASWAINNIADDVFDAARRERLLSDLTGASTRAVFDGSRETVSRNAIAENVKLRRVAQATACLFCATLATRGAVYLSVEAASFNSLGKKYHDHCKCVVVPERDGTFFTEPEYYEMFERRYVEAKKAVGPHSQFNDSEDPNAYLRAILAEMRKQEAALPKAFGGVEDLTPAWDQSGWSDERKALRLALDQASTLEDLEKAAQKLMDAGPKSQLQTGGHHRFPPRVVLTSATAQGMAHPLLREPPGVMPTPLVLENVRGAIRAVDDFQYRYPGIYLDGITFHNDTDGTFAATWRVNPNGWNEGSSKINMNARWLNSTSDNAPHLATLTGKTFDAEFDATVDVGYHYRRDGGKGSPTDRSGPTGQPSSYAVMMHELGHGMANHTNAGGKYLDRYMAPPDEAKRIPARGDNPGNFVPSALADYYAKTRVGSEAWKKQDSHGGNTRWTGKQLTEFNDWCYANMSGYSFRQGSYSFNGPEAIAEAFADVEVNGPYARETSKVLHRVLVDAYRGDTPYPGGGAPGAVRGILDADPDFMDWPDYRVDSDAMHSPINYQFNRANGQQVTGMSKRLDGVDASESLPTSTRVEIPYVRNNTGMRDVAGFGQDAEPWGRYMSPAGDGEVNLQSGWERGTATLERPLYVDHSDGNWKSKLSAQYGGSTGQELSDKLLADGFDGVVTQDDRGIVEFVDVRPRAQRRFKVEESTSTWQQAGIPPLKRTSWEESEYAKLDDKRLSKEQRAAVRAVVDERYKELAAGPADEITSAVYQTLVDVGAVPHGLEYRMKDPPSLYRKVQDEMVKSGSDNPAEVLAKMRDTVRFTAVVPADGYWQSGNKIRDALVELGAVPEKQPAGISLEGYRGRNMTFKINGVEFELQVHTEQSMSIKDICHKMYEEERLPTTSPARVKELQDRQQKLWDSILMTKGTPMLAHPKDPEPAFVISQARINVGPTVPKLDRDANGRILLPYGPEVAGMKHPSVRWMAENTAFNDMAAWERLTPEEKEWGILWYPRLNWFLAEDALGTVYEGDQRRLVAIYAALSPQTDFDVNYAAVRQVLSMDPKDVARLVPRPKEGQPIPTDEFGERPFLNGVIPSNLERVKRILAVDDSGKWVVDDPVWALRSTDANDLFYPHPSKNKVRLYHRSSLEAADSIRVQKRFISNEGSDVFLSDSLDGQALGYGDGVVVLDVPRARWQPKKGEWTPGIDDNGVFHGIAGRIDDEFPSGEKHYAISLDDIDEKWFVKPRNIPEARAENARIMAQREQFDRAVYEEVKAHGGVTINLDGEVPHDGFAYAPAKGTEVRIPRAVFKPEDVDHFIDAHLDQLERPGSHLGLWVQGDDVFLDVSVVGKPTAATIRAAQDAEQLAVYDLGNNSEVTIGTEDPDGGFEAAGTPAGVLADHKREVEREAERRSPTSSGEVSGSSRRGTPEHLIDTAHIEQPYLMLQRGVRDQAELDAQKIYMHALNCLGEEDDWAVTVDVWDARIKVSVRDDKSRILDGKGKPLQEARRILDGVSGPGKPNASQAEKNQIYQEFAEATRVATEIIREMDPWARELARKYGFEDLLPKHVQAGGWGRARWSLY